MPPLPAPPPDDVIWPPIIYQMKIKCYIYVINLYFIHVCIYFYYVQNRYKFKYVCVVKFICALSGTETNSYEKAFKEDGISWCFDVIYPLGKTYRMFCVNK